MNLSDNSEQVSEDKQCSSSTRPHYQILLEEETKETKPEISPDRGPPFQGFYPAVASYAPSSVRGLKNGETLNRIHRDVVSGVQLARDGRRVVTISQDGFIKVYCLEMGHQLVSYCVSTMPLTCLQLLPGDEAALIGARDNNIYIFNLVQCVSTQPMEYAHDDSVIDINWTHNLLLTCSDDCSAKLWSLPWDEASGNYPEIDLVAILDHDHPVRAVTIAEAATGPTSVPGPALATATDAGLICLWTLDDLSAPVMTFSQFHTSPVTSVSFDDGAAKLTSSCLGGILSVVDVSTGTQILASSHNHTPITGLAAIQGGDQSVLGGLFVGRGGSGQENGLEVWDMVAGRKIETLAVDEKQPLGKIVCGVSCVDVKPGIGVAAGLTDGSLLLWQIQNS